MDTKIKNRTGLQVFILTVGVFSIINTEMGVVGILPIIAEQYGVTISAAGALVSLFALAVAIAGPTMPLICSKFERKAVMLTVLGVFTVCNLISAFASEFWIVLTVRIIPAFFHPVYVSLAMSVAAASVDNSQAPKAVAKVMMGVSAGMVLGVPIVSSLVDITSLRIGMLFFAFVNGVAFLATLIFIPRTPVTKKLSYGSQLGVLKRPGVWLSILGVVFLNGSLFGVYSYLSDFLGRVTGLSQQAISIVLLVYGLANIVGNAIAGKALSEKPLPFILASPFILAVIFLLMLLIGGLPVPMACLLLIWGILAGCVGNINQYWISAAAPEAPDFANGLFLASTNLGTTIGSALCGWIIGVIGINWVEIGGFIMLAGCVFFLLFRAREMGK